MVTTAAGLAIDLNDDLDGTTAVGFRRALAVLFKQSSPGVAETGRLGSDHLVVSGDPGAMRYHVSAGGIVITRAATGGAYIVGLPQGDSIDTNPSDGINPRIDIIYCRQPDPALDGSSIEVDFVVDVAIGTPASSPIAPTLPDGAVELARKQLAADASNTSGGLPFTNIAPTTGLNFGGTVGISQGGTAATTKAGARSNLGFLFGTGAPSNALGEDGDTYDQIL
ncbi:hypothetical protein [Microbacterium trichothecenolyticum]|uniref:Uncharacterized protein n=1 Tax=Microbacterium trichothecenolyticum TaxID=69370 RepID=A0A0M2H751_MICTR|nr:hypothetical protein [Microbacterium trichothecenolyticum]KJL39903.1 hypothetical protein RS82_04116 [Microbacterium trichothecenolyticum]